MHRQAPVLPLRQPRPELGNVFWLSGHDELAQDPPPTGMLKAGVLIEQIVQPCGAGDRNYDRYYGFLVGAHLEMIDGRQVALIGKAPSGGVVSRH